LPGVPRARPLAIDSGSSWRTETNVVGTEDPRAYLHNICSDQHGPLADDAPEPISRYLRQTDDQYWTD